MQTQISTGLAKDSHTSRNRFPSVHYAIGNEHITAFRYDYATQRLFEKVGKEYLPVIAFHPSFASGGQALKWAEVYAVSLQAALSTRYGRANAALARRAAQCEADLAIWGMVQL